MQAYLHALLPGSAWKRGPRRGISQLPAFTSVLLGKGLKWAGVVVAPGEEGLGGEG